jgi:lysophospholipase L1-like esterase
MNNKMLFIICVLNIVCIVSLQAQDIQGNSATTPVARDGSGYERYLLLNERIRTNQGELDVLFIGDSITQGWESSGQEVWEEFYGSRNALNIGISADRTQHVLWRLEKGNIDGIFPRVVVVMIGTNNSGQDRNTAAEILGGITAIAGKVRSSLPDSRILLLGIFPRGKEFNEQRGQILQVNQALRNLEDREHIYFLDIGHVFLEADGTISEDIMPDALHLSPAGYRLWAESMEGLLSELLGDKK